MSKYIIKPEKRKNLKAQVAESEYQGHKIFQDLGRYIDFYNSWAFSTFSFVTQGTTSIVNIDSYIFSSIKGTLSSIDMILKNGRINDSWALLRKYHDSIIINIYSCLFLKDNFSINNFVVEKINDWLHGKASLPEFRIMSQYIRSHDDLSELNGLIYETDDRYKKIRNRCNDNTHYNFFKNMLLNDNETYILIDCWLIYEIFLSFIHLTYFLYENTIWLQVIMLTTWNVATIHLKTHSIGLPHLFKKYLTITYQLLGQT